MSQPDPLPPITDHSPLTPRQSMAAGLGDMVRSVFDPNTRMGSWTGLPPVVGAPVSGALWGAGLGAAYGGVRSILSDEEDTGEPVPWYRTPWILGALAGTGVGIYAGMDKGASYLYDRNTVIRAVLSDNSLTPYQRNQVVAVLDTASLDAIRRLISMLGVGGLTGLAVYKILRAGIIPSLLLGATAAHIYGTYTKPTQYI